MENYADRIGTAREALLEAEHIVIGAGSGLSTAAGLDYGGQRFAANFADFIARYPDLGDNMYSASFYPFGTPEELWAHWARHIMVNRFDPPALPLYKALLDFVSRKNFFVITTNADGQFEKAGFPRERLFVVQGDYAYIQCARACHKKLYWDRDIIEKMAGSISDCRVPSALVPRCPVCGGPMDINLRKDEFFVEDDAWHDASRRYSDYMKEIAAGKFVLLELGVGFNTPAIIRYPFEQIAHEAKDALLVRLNRDNPEGPWENEKKTIAFDEDMAQVLTDLAAAGSLY
ncbi:MAG TPA: Sir2 silent information regulator family NAD-dependent deacetylase [Candidatus Cryptobacteroides sp.]|nr:Sir2 silent information regulator family NAD-dependent deacetylase [Candidatus Cryptobacteroides sp.]